MSKTAYAAILVTFSAAAMSGCGPRESPATGQSGAMPTLEVKSTPTTAPAKKGYTRAEFSRLATGKTAGQMIDTFGKPDSTQEFGGHWWYYYKITTDPVTGKVDNSAQVVFQDGVVVGVNY